MDDRSFSIRTITSPITRCEWSFMAENLVMTLSTSFSTAAQDSILSLYFATAGPWMIILKFLHPHTTTTRMPLFWFYSGWCTRNLFPSKWIFLLVPLWRWCQSTPDTPLMMMERERVPNARQQRRFFYHFHLEDLARFTQSVRAPNNTLHSSGPLNTYTYCRFTSCQTRRKKVKLFPNALHPSFRSTRVADGN